MNEKPILFNGEMVRAILEGRKTQTRRPLSPQPQLFKGKFEFTGGWDGAWPEPNVWLALSPSGKFGLTNPPYYRCPFGQVGDILWVRETWAITGPWDNQPLKTCGVPVTRGPVWYRADGFLRIDPNDRADQCYGRGKWRPSIHMPKWVCRIRLRVKRVWVERVHDITEENARAEGLPANWGGPVSDGWDPDKHGFLPQEALKMDPDDALEDECFWTGCEAFASLWDSIYGTWSENPWVWCCEFEAVVKERANDQAHVPTGAERKAVT